MRKVAEPTLIDVDGLLFGKDEKESLFDPWTDSCYWRVDSSTPRPVVQGEMGLCLQVPSPKPSRELRILPPNNEGLRAGWACYYGRTHQIP